MDFFLKKLIKQFYKNKIQKGTVSGLGMIGSFHYNENTKIEQMSKAMSGLALGVLA